MNNLLEKIQKNAIISSLLVIMPFLYFSIQYLSNNLRWGGDDAQILTQAIAIINNSISSQINDYRFIIDNSVDPIGTKAYSWGVPILLSILQKIYLFFVPVKTQICENINYFYLKLSMVFFYAGTILLLYKELIRRVSYSIAIIFTFLFAFSPYLIDFANEIMKDIPFTFLSFLAIVTFNKLAHEERLYKKIQLAIFSCIVTFLCLITRENGSIILFAFSFSYIYNLLLDIRNKTNKIKINTLIYFVTFFITAGCFFLFSKFFPVEYIKNIFQYDIFSILNNIKYYVGEFKICFFNFNNYGIFYLVIFSSLSIYGLFKNYKKEPLISFFLILICTHFVVSAGQGIRYILPFVPFIFIFAALGLNKINNKIIKYILAGFFIIAILLNIANIHTTTKQIADFKNSGGVTSKSAKEVYEYIKTNTKNTDTFIYCKPRVLHLFTNRLAFQISSRKELLNKGDYQLSIIGNEHPGEFYNKEMFDFDKKTYIKEANIFFIPVYRNDNYALYKIENN